MEGEFRIMAPGTLAVGIDEGANPESVSRDKLNEQDESNVLDEGKVEESNILKLQATLMMAQALVSLRVQI